MVRNIEDLRLKRNGLALGKLEASRQPKVDLLRPRSVEGIQTYKWTGATGVDAEGRIRRGLQSR